MSPDLLFGYATMLAVSGWVALIVGRFAWRDHAETYAGLVVPGILAVAYAGLVLAFWSGAEGGFDTLDSVAQLFQSPEILLAGWLHYLAFDLFVGTWEVRAARAAGIPFLFVLPCLALTFLFGPAGLLAFLILRAALATARPAATNASF